VPGPTLTDHVALRRATADDLPALNALMQASGAYRDHYAPMLQGYAATSAQVAADHMVLAERHGEILGFYSLITEGEPELDLMFVADAAQGLGLGERLFRDMAQAAAARGIDAVKIVSNPPAAGFYERMGAVRVATKMPKGRVTWTQPILYLRIAGSIPPL
jgi:ribosomal protein S18 acetylase RimI-like enzyme